MDLPGLDYNFLEAKVSLAFFSPPRQKAELMTPKLRVSKEGDNMSRRPVTPRDLIVRWFKACSGGAKLSHCTRR